MTVLFLMSIPMRRGLFPIYICGMKTFGCCGGFAATRVDLKIPIFAVALIDDKPILFSNFLLLF
jgi:hypothetical protein